MKLFLLHVTIMLVGIHLVVGGMMRIHHHSENDMICFCIDGKIDPICDHHHDDCDNHKTGNHDGCHSDHGEEDTCAFHLDDFNMSSNDDDVLIPQPFMPVNLIAAILFCEPSVEETGNFTYFSSNGDTPIETWTDDTSGRRGPPYCHTIAS